MSYERKCLCCRRERERRHFPVFETKHGKRLSLVCVDCIEVPAIGRDGLWPGPVQAPAEFRSLGVRL